MQAIAMLVEDDPYLKQTAQQRCDARRERKRKLAALSFVQEIVEVPPDKTQRYIPPIAPADVAPTEPVFSFGQWVERQRELHKPKKIWFSIVDEIDNRGKKKIRIGEIQRAVCKYFGISLVDMLSRRRTDIIVLPRQIAMYLSKTLTLKSLPEIGRRFGDKDHTTILHAVRKIAAMEEKNEKTRDTIAALLLDLGVA